jgi:hypothetical protein
VKDFVRLNTQFELTSPEKTRSTEQILVLHNRYCEYMTKLSEIYNGSVFPRDRNLYNKILALQQRILVMKWILGYVQFDEHPLSGVPILDETIDRV